MSGIIDLDSLFTNAIKQAVSDPDLFAEYLGQLGRQAAGPALSILVIVVVSFLVLRALRMLVQKTIRRLMERSDQPARELTLKANTLSSVVESAGRMVVLIVAGMMVLDNLGFDIAPLIASAGVAGIAIGLGAQSLIKDLIGGFFILFEDQFGVGDVIRVNGAVGTVELLSLRRTGIRGIDGTFIIVPNGDIRLVENLTKEWSRAVIDVDISYDDDVDQAIAVLKDLLEGIENDPELGDAIIAPADVLGVQALGAYQVTIRVMVKTGPTERWRVERELRRRIKRGITEAGITIPYPHNVSIVRPTDGNGPLPTGAGADAPSLGEG